MLKKYRAIQLALLAAALSSAAALPSDSSGCRLPPEASGSFRVATVVQECAYDPVTINDPSVAEGTGGTTKITFEVTRAPIDTPMTVAYRTFNGTATAAQDFHQLSGTLSFGPSPTPVTQTVQVTVVADSAMEGDETFVLRLDGTAAAVLHKPRGIGTILNDDSAVPEGGPARVAPAPAPAPGEAPPAGAAPSLPRPRTSATQLPSPAAPPSLTAPAGLPATPEPTATASAPEPSTSPVSRSSESTNSGAVSPVVAAGLVILALGGMGGWAFRKFGRTP